MATIQLNARENEKAKPVTATINFPDDIDAAIKQWGRKETFQLMKAAAMVRMQSAMRTLIKDKKGPIEIGKLLSAWKPSVRQAGVSKVDKTRSMLDKLSPEDRAALLKEAMKSGKSEK